MGCIHLPGQWQKKNHLLSNTARSNQSCEKGSSRKRSGNASSCGGPDASDIPDVLASGYRQTQCTRAHLSTLPGIGGTSHSSRFRESEAPEAYSTTSSKAVPPETGRG